MANPTKKPKTGEICLVFEADRHFQHLNDLPDLFKKRPVSVIIVHRMVEKNIGKLKQIVKMAKPHEIAILVTDDVAIALEARADGVHLFSKADEVRAAIAIKELKETVNKDFILGGQAKLERHGALVMGEKGADYIAFGQIDHHLSTSTNNKHDLTEAWPKELLLMVGWWAETCKIPTLIFGAKTKAMIDEIGLAGADYIAVDYELWQQL